MRWQRFGLRFRRMRCSALLAGGSRALADATALLAGREGGCDAAAAAAGPLARLAAEAKAGRAGRERGTGGRGCRLRGRHAAHFQL